ncbi:MAG: biotin--[Clostridia bacterium]|nr:biotin--[acetyl-CoA-carboxylase] ligase [Clostridia bacterium]
MEIFEILPSTNDVAYDSAMAGAPHLYAVLAKSQSAGRGRQGRSFLSPAGGTYLSIVLRPALPHAAYGVIPPVAAMLVRRVLARVAGVNADIKWVNDLLLGGKKLAGLLAKSGVDCAGKPFVVLGIGINTGGSVPAEIAEIATAIAYPDPVGLAHALLTQFAALDEVLAGDWCAEYRLYAPFLGSMITVHERGTVRAARALDILPDGALRILEENGTVTALVGDEITLRTAQNDRL